ncbi:cell division protein SepF [Corynebacterium halotolerans]|uniref:Cell division protein SepF n=1 Tax=Corynebacterium halotolerans YIM 70093 = DSM 44683 TaxID=1121362 RepID=M1NNF2_9CORY|nr:cell division protein SepF [Corynebacterium halotolerans]AGF72888.1 hypothetical protein A605_09430 [Corynebacterium halotolerans YIM 70093 = DSM 44683]
MSIMKSAKEFFGLAPVDMEHEDAYYDDEPRYRNDGSAAYAPAPRRERDYDDYDRYPEPEAPAPAPAPVAPRPAPRAYSATIVPVQLTSYTEATLIGEPFRDGDAVVFDLTHVDKSEAKRVIDFAAGLCFAVRGQMKKLDGGERTLFAIVPENASVSTLDLERAAGLR